MEEDVRSENVIEQELKRKKVQILSSIRVAKSTLHSKVEILCIDDLKTFVEENKYNGSQTQEFFVADAKLGDGSKENPIIITLTSRTCLNYMKDQAEKCTPQFAWDGTYKVNSFRFSLMVTATQDSAHTATYQTETLLSIYI